MKIVAIITYISASQEWRALSKHAKKVRKVHLRELMRDSERSAALFLEGPCGAVVDWSRQKVTVETMALLVQLAEACDVDGKRAALRRGDVVNPTEGRPASHHRRGGDEAIYAFADRAAFEAVIVVGIGGSHLGPEFACRALESGDVDVRFLSNVDPEALESATRGLDPAKTLAVVSSKSFTTQETMRNADRLKKWGCAFVACTANADAARAWGVDEVFTFDVAVGGRFSATSAPGLVPLALAAGSAAAREFVEGAKRMDEHFFEAPLAANLPVVLALLGLWNRNFLGFPCRAVVPYSRRLSFFPAHVQQLEMESNGKSLALDTNQPLPYKVGEIVFGAPGTDAQHSFFQFLHAGTDVVPVDFVAFLTPPAAVAAAQRDAHDELIANLLAQADALALGKDKSRPFEVFEGDRPSLTILFPRRRPAAVGALLALYEHRTAVLGWLWDVNSWDQPGVELGKSLAAALKADIVEEELDSKQPRWSPSTLRLLKLYKESR